MQRRRNVVAQENVVVKLFKEMVVIVVCDIAIEYRMIACEVVV